MSIDLDEVHEISIDLLESMHEVGIPIGMMMAALVMSLGRLSTQRKLEPEEEAAFIQAVMSFSGAYFAEGKVN